MDGGMRGGGRVGWGGRGEEGGGGGAGGCQERKGDAGRSREQVIDGEECIDGDGGGGGGCEEVIEAYIETPWETATDYSERRQGNKGRETERERERRMMQKGRDVLERGRERERDKIPEKGNN